MKRVTILIFRMPNAMDSNSLVKERPLLNGTAQAPDYKNGLAFIITPEGEDYCESLTSDYAKEYRRCAESVIRQMTDKSERAIISDINKRFAEALRKGARE